MLQKCVVFGTDFSTIMDLSEWLGHMANSTYEELVLYKILGVDNILKSKR